MTDPTPNILAVTVQGTYLYAVSKSGLLLPLYYYGPLNSDQPPADVPYVDQWLPYVQDFSLEYFPVPALSADQLPDDIETQFSTQARPPESRRPWTQAVFRGWPVYLHGDGTTPDETPGGQQDQAKFMFRQISTTIEQGPITGESGTVGGPPVSIGP